MSRWRRISHHWFCSIPLPDYWVHWQEERLSSHWSVICGLGLVYWVWAGATSEAFEIEILGLDQFRWLGALFNEWILDTLSWFIWFLFPSEERSPLGLFWKVSLWQQDFEELHTTITIIIMRNTITNWGSVWCSMLWVFEYQNKSLNRCLLRSHTGLRQ